ncbi:MAG: M14 family metallopeptidase [Gemmatimonadota bacterium]
MIGPTLRPVLAGSALLAAVGLYAPLVGQAAPAAVPSPEQYLGYALGEDFTDYTGVRDYSRVLAAESPLVEYIRYGESVEGRELIQLVIARADHHARLDEILAANAELTRAGTSEARARQIAAEYPAVVYFTYGVHGNESSSSEAALWTAYDIATGSPEVAGVLDSLVVVIDPVTNPDGRDRYVQWYRSVVGETPNADPQTREHREPWPGGRFNHYLFDLNRDWAWMTQPETRARLATWWRWNPVVHVDFHEMSPNSTYFFFPATPPINPIYPDHILEWGRRFGEGNARAFDANGWHYFTGESYDMLYPGYGDSWPSLHGAIGMTYEQAGGGSAGLAYARSDGDTLTLHRRASQHRTAGNATLRTSAAGKTALQLGFAEAHRTAGLGEADVLLVPGADPSRLNDLVDHLLAQGIEVERAESAFRSGADAYPDFEQRIEFPEGTALVRARQPRGRLALTLLQPETELVGEYSYDISAWSLPYAYGVEAHQTASPPAAGWTAAVPTASTSEGIPAASYGYLAAPNDRVAAGIVRYLADGGYVRVLSRPSSFAGRDWPAGTWYIPVRPGTDVRARLETAGLGGSVVPVSTGLSDGGIDLGSANTPAVRLPRVALFGGQGVGATSYGAHWYHLEQQLGMPFDAVLLPELARLDLAQYDVIVLPHIGGQLEEDARETLEAWVRGGGRLVAVAGASEAVAAIAGVAIRGDGEPAEGAESLAAGLATREARERDEWMEEVPGVILQTRTDPGHPITWGSSYDRNPDRLFVLHEGGAVFEPSQDAETVAFFDAGLSATSGVISEANLNHLEQGAWLVSTSLGSGEVILFADDPLFRLFWRSTMPLYFNAIMLGGL